MNLDKIKIVFFDGVCNLCNSSVDLIIRKNEKENLYFASLQSDFAKVFFEKMNFKSEDLKSIIFYSEGNFYNNSTAVLKICKELSGICFFFSFFEFLPEGLRDFFYKVIAKRRYKFFGKQETCRIPTKSEKSRFLKQL
ncbi:MAG: DUF393 domain-containing protein [Calditrichaeota bacterium]|nr:MAG: DUF393 domain-containing protein [Calditrichota bacterium]